MKKILILTLLFSQLVFAQNKTTTVYLIRHAEKMDNSKNPDLSEAGQQRAKHWNDIFASIKFNVVYSTDFKRTQQTATPTAQAQQKEIIIYDPKAMTLDKIKADHDGQTILIVGHSNSTPELANKLIGQKIYPMMDESVFGNLYIITLSNDAVSHQLLKSL